jgi:hypothetical protein
MEERESPGGVEVGDDFDDVSGEGAAEHPQRLDADYLLDRVIPGEIDWRDLVRRHPVISVGVAATIGLLLGRGKGQAIITGLSTALTGAVMRQLSDVFDGDVFEF